MHLVFESQLDSESHRKDDVNQQQDDLVTNDGTFLQVKSLRSCCNASTQMAMVWSSWRCEKVINLPNFADKWDMCMTLQSCVTGHIWYKVNGNHGGWQCKPSRYRFVRQQVTTLHECTANQSNHGLQQRSSWPGVLLVAVFGRNFDGHVPRFNTLQSAMNWTMFHSVSVSWRTD